MPIVSNLNLSSTNGIQSTAFAISRSKIEDQIFTIYGLPNQLGTELNLQELNNQIISNLQLVERGTNQPSVLNINQDEPFTFINIELDLKQITTSGIATLIQYVGVAIPANNPNKLLQVPFLLEETYEKIISLKNFNQNSRRNSNFEIVGTQVPIIDYYQSLLNTTNPLSFFQNIGSSSRSIAPFTIELTQIGLRGPDIVNAMPPKNSSFNSPNTNVSFDMYAWDNRIITSGSFYVEINGLTLVSGGIITCPPTSGTVIYEKISDFLYHFEFDPAQDFNPNLNPVLVSGSILDEDNTTNFSYYFNILYTEDLAVNILGIPDNTPPYLKDLIPFNGQTDVLVNSNINFSITDDLLGVESGTVTIKVDGVEVVKSGGLVNQNFAVVSYSGIDSGNGIGYTINPTMDFEYSSTVTVEVYAEDKFYYSPNVLNTLYQFNTRDNSHLLASNFEIKVEDNYVPFDLAQSLPISLTGVDFKVRYSNLLNLGISTSGSEVLLNGVTLTGVSFVSVSGTNIYDVFFSLTPDYTTDCDITFHLEQLTLVSGSVLYRNFDTELLWGAEFCYDPATDLTYSTEVPVIIQVEDFGFKSSRSSKSYIFNTTPMPSNGLYASIIGIEDVGTISGSYLSNNPFYEYGKAFNLEIEAEDYAGNKLNYTWSYKIETKPS